MPGPLSFSSNYSQGVEWHEASINMLCSGLYILCKSTFLNDTQYQTRSIVLLNLGWKTNSLSLVAFLVFPHCMT